MAVLVRKFLHIPKRQCSSLNLSRVLSDLKLENIKPVNTVLTRLLCTATPTQSNPKITVSSPAAWADLEQCFMIHPDFITEEEENSLYEQAQRYLKRLRYEYDHWDNAIHGYRETEKSEWSEENQKILQRVRDIAFPESRDTMAFVHILDLAKDGYIKPHIDSTRFCGDTIAGISILSSSVMRLINDKDKSKCADCLLERRSLYIMKGTARFDYSHEVLKDEESHFKGTHIPRDRRISIICRKEPPPSTEDS